MKKILGLDLGTNSIGWALIKESENKDEKSEILGLGSRIIPMSQDILGEFDKGNSVSQTAERTGFRGIRRLRERHLLRRERLHRVLNILGFLPEHYAESIDFSRNVGQFKDETEPKLVYRVNPETGKAEFILKQSFAEMVEEFKQTQPQLFEQNKKIPYDWTIYFLRKKALTEKIEKEELAWLLLNFNQKRGYYQLRGEDDEEATKTAKTRKYFEKQIIKNIIDTSQIYKGLKVLVVELENGNKGKIFKKEIPNWIGSEMNIIATVDIDKDGNDKLEEDGLLSQRFAIPTDAEWETEWKLIKLKTEKDLADSHKTVGCYIYDTLLQKPEQKINGKLVRTIERKFYRQELEAILNKQKEFHPELNNTQLYQECLFELYEHNDAHRNSIGNKDFTHLFLNDIIFYQRPLKSKKSLISNCPYETRTYFREGKKETEPLKCIAKSNPLFQEFRLWQFIQNLKIYARERIVNGKTETDINVTNEFLKTEDDSIALFEFLNERKEIKQDTLLTAHFNIKKAKGATELPYRWNYVEDKEYPCNETHAQINTRLSKCSNLPNGFLTTEKEFELWHILYSVEDKHEIKKALHTFATKNKLGEDFIEQFQKFPPFKKEYGSYSEKAIKKLLALMRMGKYWNETAIPDSVRIRIASIIERLQTIINEGKTIDEVSDDFIPKQVLKSFLKCTEPTKGLNTYQACYAVYGRHSEASDIKQWKTPVDIENYLRNEFKQHSLRNPIVEQVITETLRVVKDIWQKYGNGEVQFFSEIHIELGREMKNPADKRKQMTEKVTSNENTNLRIKALLMEMMNDPDCEDVRPYSPSQQEILKIFEDGVLSQYSEAELKNEKFDDIDIFKISKTATPTKRELEKYKLWLSQKYRSPYTGKTIPLAKLFTTAYQIEHIIPQSRYFDDSFSNKVICEAEVNKDKDNATGYEYIKNNHGKIIDLNFGEQVRLFELEEYERFVKETFTNNRGKMKKLLMEDIPDDFINRQLNDSRYISKVVKSLLSNIVRQDDEQEATSKNVLSSNGTIITILKQDWGLNDVWNDLITPRFERLNELTKSDKFGQWVNKSGKQVFQTEVPFEIQKGFSKKRIDHRHHAMDALVIACATRNHINYLNNEFAAASKKDIRFDLRKKLRRIETIEKDVTRDGETNRIKMEVAKEFLKPWDSFTQDAFQKLQTTVVSFKQNLRVINKTVNKYQHWKIDENGNKEKVIEKQVKGDSWAIRKPMHKDTVSGKITLRFKKTVNLSVALEHPEMIVDKVLKKKVLELNQIYSDDKKKVLKFFKDIENIWENKDVSKVEVYYLDSSNVASRVNIDESFTSDRIKTSITDTGIIKILLNHLAKYNFEDEGKIKEQPDLAFSADGIDELNKNIVSLNNGQPHKPIYKVRTYEPQGIKFNVGHAGSKKDKFVEAAKGTNLFFAMYKTDDNKRVYETIPLHLVIERQKQGLSPVPERNENGCFLISYLSPNDLVYVPTIEEQVNPQLVNPNQLTSEQVKRVYKTVSFSGNQCFFVRNDIANTIVNKFEFAVNNKMERSIEGIMIKEVCWKLKVDRLGNII